MKANGCKIQYCHWPEDKGLQLTPSWLSLPTAKPGAGTVFEIECDCTWTNYRGPSVARKYTVCLGHYQQALDMLEDQAKESKQIDEYLARRRK